MPLIHLFRPFSPALRIGTLYAARLAAAGVALCTASIAFAQIVSIPLGGPRPARPSPNAALLGAPAGIADAVGDKSRPPAMRRLDGSNHPVEVLGFLGLSRGVRGLVIEHDPGYFGEIVATAVGSGGRVVELVRPAAMEDAAVRAMLSEEIGLAPNLSVRAALPATVRLSPASFDFVLLHLADDILAPVTVSHPAPSTDAATFVEKLFAAVRPGGVVGIVGQTTAVGDEADRIRRDFGRVGFVLDNQGRLRGGGDDESDAFDAAALTRSAGRFILKFRKPE